MAGNQFARLEAENAAQVVEDALIASDLMEPNRPLRDLGVGFLGTAIFTVPFPARRRCIVVKVESDERPSSLVSVQSRPLASPLPDVRPTVVLRRSARRDLAHPDAPDLCFEVANTIHQHVALLGLHMRWNVDADPMDARPVRSPRPPKPDGVR